MEEAGAATTRRFSEATEERKKTLRMSNVGTPCKRKLWYYTNLKEEEKDLPPNLHLKFLYGDILEALMISLAKAAGHEISGEQGEVEVAGIKGHRDCVIDGMVVDVKSAATFSFQKFKDNNIRSDDPFGYLKQLTGYVLGAKNDPLVTYKTSGAFLAVDKQHGHICLDVYDLTEEMKTFEAEVHATKAIVNGTFMPRRWFEPVPDGKSGNMKLPVSCSYCDFKVQCWPGLRAFAYSSGPAYLTKVGNLPRVPEFKP